MGGYVGGADGVVFVGHDFVVDWGFDGGVVGLWDDVAQDGVVDERFGCGGAFDGFVCVGRVEGIAVGVFDDGFAEARFDGVETDAKDAHDVGDGDECVFIDGLDRFVDFLRFAFSRDEVDRFAVLFGVPSDRLEERDAAVVFVDDLVGNFAVSRREDEHLNRLPAAVADGVDDVCLNAHEDEAVGDGFDRALRQEIRRGDDAGVEDEVDAAPCDVFVFRDDHDDDVGTARRRAAQEIRGDARAGDDAAHDAAQELIL